MSFRRWVSPLVLACVILSGSGPAPGPVNNSCKKCVRSFQKLGDIPDVDICWVPDINDNGRDGQCRDDDKNCSHILCKWLGELQVHWNGTGPVAVAIGGPGEEVACEEVWPGQYCGKTFAMPDNPIQRACPDGIQDVDVEVDADTVIARFKCGECQ